MEAPGRIAAWERMQAEFQERTSEVPLSAWSKRQVMLSMLPPQVQEYINVRGHYGQELSYQQIKEATMALVQRNSVGAPMPQDCMSFNSSPGIPGYEEAPQQATQQKQGEEDLDAFGKGPRTSPLGKGAPGGPGWKGAPNPNKDKTCDMCGRIGHIKKDCWFRAGGEKGPDRLPKKKGSGKGKGDRQKGTDGRWYKKTGTG